MSTSTHSYSLAQQPKMLLKWAKLTATEIRKAIAKHAPGSIPVLCYRGMSGSAHATALAMILEERNFPFHMVYVRKTEERSHGDVTAEDTLMSHKYIDQAARPLLTPVFVDDLVDSGSTEFKTMETALARITMREGETSGLYLRALLRRVTPYEGYCVKARGPVGMKATSACVDPR